MLCKPNQCLSLVCVGLAFLLAAITIVVPVSCVSSSDNYPSYSLSNFDNCTDPETPCWNGGHCELSDIHKCVCPEGFTSLDCRDKVCVNGKMGTLNNCGCEEGWGGEFCLACANDFGCQSRYNSTNSTGHCDQTYITQKKKFFECVVTDEIFIGQVGNLTTMQCTNVSFTHDAGYCEFQAWAMDSPNFPSGYRSEVFFCTFFNCQARIYADDKNKVSYNCKTSKCHCGTSSKCDEFVKFIIDNMKGKGSVTCNNQTKVCDVDHEDYPGIIPLICNGAECVEEYVPPPPPPPDYSWIYGIVAASGGGLLILGIIIVVIASSIVSCCHTRYATKEYHSIKHKDHGASLEFRNLVYQLKVTEKGRTYYKTLLNSVSHYIRPGSVVALMGPSGAGKTTLLDILANRSKRGRLNGQILVDGKPIDKSYKRTCGYVFQEDILMSTMTVRECLMFSANLRLPDAIPTIEKERRVNEVMKELGIYRIADRQIGDAMNRGISGGEKRRVSIGMELVISPYILFLDEPTSGLDSTSAYSVICSLVELAKKGRTIVFSIHQPRTNIFHKFDEILLLSGGNIAYAGPANRAVEYFDALGYKCPPNFNPADHLIDLLSQSNGKPFNFEDQSKRIGFDPNRSSYGTSNVTSEYPQIEVQKERQIVDGSENTSLLGENSKVIEGGVELLPHATSLFSQIQTLSKRAFTNFYRNFYLMPAHYLSAIAVGALLGSVYYKLDFDLQAVQNRIGSMFFMCSLLCFGAMSSLELFINERAIYVREKANGYYYSLAYFVSKVLFDIIPLRIIPPILMGSIAYFLIGLRLSMAHFAWFLLVLILFNLVSGGLCILIGSISPSVAAGNVTAVLLILLNSLFAGFLLNKESTPEYLSWVKYLSFWNYAFEALLINELYGVTVLINPKGAPPFHADGNFWLLELGMDHGRFYLDVIVLSVFAVLFIALSGVLLKVCVKERR